MPFGDGSDGDVVISVNTTLTRDMNYNNLTIDAGVTLYPDGYVIYVSDTLTVNGVINRNGNSGGVSPGAALPTRSLGGSGGGGGGGYYNPSYAQYAYPPTDGENVVNGVAGSVGGDGEDGIVYDGGKGGLTTNFVILTDDNINELITNAANMKGGPGGGGGGDTGGSYTGCGGPSGAGVIFIEAQHVVISITGKITAIGGSSSSTCCRKGGGGGGGCVAIRYSDMTNNGEIDVSGGIFGGSAATSGVVFYSIISIAAAEATKPGRLLHRSTGASVSGGMECGMGKRQR